MFSLLWFSVKNTIDWGDWLRDLTGAAVVLVVVVTVVTVLTLVPGHAPDALAASLLIT